MKQCNMNVAQPTLSLSLSAESRIQRVIGLPTTTDGLAPTLTAVYEVLGPANMISCGHYPKMGVGVIFET